MAARFFNLADRATLHRLRQHGFLIHTKVGQLLPNGRLKCDLDLEMALDIQAFVARARPDIVVIVSGDGDFTPLAQRLRFDGVRVEVASIPGSVSADLRAMANGFVDLTRLGDVVDYLPIPEHDAGPDDAFDADLLDEFDLAPEEGAPAAAAAHVPLAA